MDKKEKIFCFSKGIHIKKLNKDELEQILNDYYHIKISHKEKYKIEFVHKEGQEKESVLKEIYFNALSTILWSGYHIPASRFEYLMPVDPYLYYDDMVMMLYLYIINLNPPISANQLPISPETQTELKTIEQSGFGTVLGIRRKNVDNDSNVGDDSVDNDSNVGDDSVDNEIQKYVHSKSILQKIVFDNLNVNSSAQSTIQNVIRSEHENKYSIPAICTNVLIALIKSRKYNPFLFALSENKSEDEAISLFNQLEENLKKILFKEIGKTIENPLTIFSKDIQEVFAYFESMGNLISSDFHNFLMDKNYENYDRFYRQYNIKLDQALEKSEITPHLEVADLYLSELLFANKYYVDIIKQLKKELAITSISEKAIKQIMDTVYNVSESMLCFSRKKHVELYLDILFNRKNIAENNKKITEKKLLKLLNKMNKTENYTRQKFAPALYYCFLYYIIDKVTNTKGFNKDQLLSILKEEMKDFNKNLKLPRKMKLKNVFSDENMKLLLFQRKQRFLVPLKYSIEKALF